MELRQCVAMLTLTTSGLILSALQLAVCISSISSSSSHEAAALNFHSLAASLRAQEHSCQQRSLASRTEDVLRHFAPDNNYTIDDCPGQFDGLLCWPNTAAGRDAALPCPAKLFAGDGWARRHCVGGGRGWRIRRQIVGQNGGNGRDVNNWAWLRHPVTNFSECRPRNADITGRLYSLMLTTNISNETQWQRVSLEQLSCHYSRLYTAQLPPDASVCGPVFDGALCWPAAPAGSSPSLPCPDYLNEVRRDNLASRRCLGNGSWLSLDGGSQGWTNFSDCLIEDLIPVEDKVTIKMHLAVMNKIGLIGYSVSLVALLVAIFVLLIFRRLHCRRNFIHINLYAAFSLRAVSHFVNSSVSKQPEKIFCRMNQALMTFTVVCSFTWVFVEALHLYVLIFVSAMTDNGKLTIFKYVALGWGLPCLITAAWIVLRVVFDNRSCWQEYRPLGPDIWLLNTYLCLLVVINAALFVKIVRELFVKLKRQPSAIGEATPPYRKLWKSTCILVLVFGVYYIILIPVAMIPKDRLGETLDLVHLYYEHFFNSFQGFFAALLFCFVNSDVHREAKRLLFKSRLGVWLAGRGGDLLGGGAAVGADGCRQLLHHHQQQQQQAQVNASEGCASVRKLRRLTGCGLVSSDREEAALHHQAAIRTLVETEMAEQIPLQSIRETSASCDPICVPPSVAPQTEREESPIHV